MCVFFVSFCFLGVFGVFFVFLCLHDQNNSFNLFVLLQCCALYWHIALIPHEVNAPTAWEEVAYETLFLMLFCYQQIIIEGLFSLWALGNVPESESISSSWQELALDKMYGKPLPDAKPIIPCL